MVLVPRWIYSGGNWNRLVQLWGRGYGWPAKIASTRIHSLVPSLKEGYLGIHEARHASSAWLPKEVVSSRQHRYGHQSSFPPRYIKLVYSLTQPPEPHITLSRFVFNITLRSLHSGPSSPKTISADYLEHSALCPAIVTQIAYERVPIARCAEVALGTKYGHKITLGTDDSRSEGRGKYPWRLGAHI